MKRTTIIILIIAGVLITAAAGAILLTMTTLNQFHEKGVEAAQVIDTQQPDTDKGTDNTDNSSVNNGNDEDNEDNVPEPVDPYLEMVNNSKRINVVCLGIAKYLLSDTIIVASFDPESKSLDLISVPRDTYFYRPGFELPAEKKINASYYGKNSAQRAQSSMNSVRDILQIPIHHFVKIEYKGVEKIVDSIGGVEVNVPFDMNYDDGVDDLHIHFEKGKQVLNGEDAVRYLRFRKNNDNTRSDGDIGRIGRQQKFVRSAINKSLGLKLINVMNIAKDYIRTSMTAEDMILYAKELSQLDIKNVRTYTLPGRDKYVDGVSYYFQDREKTKELITKIYGGSTSDN